MNSRARIPLVFISGLFFILFSSCDMSKEEDKVNKMLSDTLFSERAEVVEIRYVDSGLLKAVLYAPVLERFPTNPPYTLFDQGVKGYFYDQNGKIDNSLKANYAISHDEEKIVELKNNVELINVKKERLNTEKLIWDQKSRKIYTDQFVKITTPENIIYGNGFEANQEFTSYRIFDVKGMVSVKDENAETN